MRMMPSRYAGGAQPVKVKQNAAAVQHLSAPLKGLSLSAKLTTGDPLKAPILDNWVIDEDRILCRPGTKLIHADPGGKPIESLVPHYGAVTQLLALATDGKLVLSNGTLVKSGFTDNDWAWTAFSNLGAATYTIMCNGKDGVWSWDGGTVAGTSCVKEAITAPATATWVNPDHLDIVITHMNRLWFADTDNLAVYYLPVQTKSGALFVLPLNAVFRRGGTIRAIYSWSIDGGSGMDDKIVIFTSNGECAIYSGVDPASDFSLVGLFRFDAPMSKHSIINYGGELHVLISTGLVPLSTMLRAETDRLGESDKDVVSAFTDASTRSRGAAGWHAILHPGMGRVICNLPLGANNRYRQMVKKMTASYWSTWSAIPARSWGWVNNALYFGSDDGKLYQMAASFLSDAGSAIKVDVQFAWSNFKTPAVKQFKMLRPYIISDGVPRPFIDMRVDYDTTPPLNQPDVTFTSIGTEWEVGTWDVDDWAGGAVMQSNWSGTAAFGTVGAPRLTAAILNCEFAVAGFDVIFETGSIMG
jgi:hypothetical protein